MFPLDVLIHLKVTDYSSLFLYTEYCIHGCLRFELDILFGLSNGCVFYLISCI